MSSTRARVFAGAVAAAWGAAGIACTVGEGSGEASGTLFVAACTAAGDLGSREVPAAYELNPGFFAGEPIEDVARTGSQTRLIIRMQRSGQRRELNDVLTFDVVDAYQVARCVRARMVRGTDGALTPDYDPAMCDGPLIRIGTDALVRASLSPRGSCRANLVGTALTCPAGLDLRCGPRQPAEWSSWLRLSSFGAAAQAGVADPERRSAVSRSFKVEFGERIHAPAFQVLLQDDRVLSAQREQNPEPQPMLVGALVGFFDFDMERGQGAQAFP